MGFGTIDVKVASTIPNGGKVDFDFKKHSSNSKYAQIL
jgi:hypothetical protein